VDFWKLFIEVEGFIEFPRYSIPAGRLGYHTHQKQILPKFWNIPIYCQTLSVGTYIFKDLIDLYLVFRFKEIIYPKIL